MNPFEVKHTFDAYFNWDKNGKKVHKPKKGNSKRKGEGWGSGNGKSIINNTIKIINITLLLYKLYLNIIFIIKK